MRYLAGTVRFYVQGIWRPCMQVVGNRYREDGGELRCAAHDVYDVGVVHCICEGYNGLALAVIVLQHLYLWSYYALPLPWELRLPGWFCPRVVSPLLSFVCWRALVWGWMMGSDRETLSSIRR